MSCAEHMAGRRFGCLPESRSGPVVSLSNHCIGARGPSFDGLRTSMSMVRPSSRRLPALGRVPRVAGINLTIGAGVCRWMDPGHKARDDNSLRCLSRDRYKLMIPRASYS